MVRWICWGRLADEWLAEKRLRGNVGGLQRQGGVSPSGTAHPPRPRCRVALCLYIHIAAAATNLPVGSKLPEEDTPTLALPMAWRHAEPSEQSSEQSILCFLRSVFFLAKPLCSHLKEQTLAALRG